MSSKRQPHNRTATSLFESGDMTPLGWEQIFDDVTGDPFFFNSSTGVTQWEEPFKGARISLQQKRQLTDDEGFVISEEIMKNPMNRSHNPKNIKPAVGIQNGGTTNDQGYSSFQLEAGGRRTDKHSNKSFGKKSTGSSCEGTWSTRFQLVLLLSMCVMFMVMTFQATNYFSSRSTNPAGTTNTSINTFNTNTNSSTTQSGGSSSSSSSSGGSSSSSSSGSGSGGPDIADPDKDFSQQEIVTTVTGSFLKIIYGVNKHGKDLIKFSFPSTSFDKLFVLTNLLERGDGKEFISHMAASPAAPVLYFALSKQRTKVTMYVKQTRLFS